MCTSDRTCLKWARRYLTPNIILLIAVTVLRLDRGVHTRVAFKSFWLSHPHQMLSGLLRGGGWVSCILAKSKANEKDVRNRNCCYTKYDKLKIAKLSFELQSSIKKDCFKSVVIEAFERSSSSSNVPILFYRGYRLPLPSISLPISLKKTPK